MYSGYKSASHNTLGGNTISTTDGTTTHNWQFGVDGRLTFPDATVQTTAYMGQANPDSVVNGSYNITLNATGDFIPNTDNLQALGSPTNRFRHLYVGPGSVYIGDSVISESVSGKLVLPGVTSATTLFASEVEETGDQTLTWVNPPFLLDAYQFGVASGTITPDPGYSPADYDPGNIDDDGYISEIDVYEPGTWTQAVADYNLINNMYAFIGTDVQEPHNPSNWVQIPFSVSAKANDVEYDFETGPSDRLVSGDAEVVLSSNGDLTIPGVIKSTSGSSYIDPGDTHVVLQTAQDVRWTFASDGELRLPQGADIVDSNGDSVLGVTVLRQDTPPAGNNGTLWFNTAEGRMYIKYTDVWVDASPLVMPQPDTDIDVNSITFADASVQTTAFVGTAVVDRLTNGTREVVLNSAGDLLSSNDFIAVQGGRFIKDCGDSTGTTSMRWIRLPADSPTELIRVYSGDPSVVDNTERVKLSINWSTPTQSGLSITAFDRTAGAVEHTWQFNGDGTTLFPTLTVPISDNANPNGTGQTLKFSDSTQQAIIYGPESTLANNTAERIIIQGAPGFTGTAGEGGDVYVWAGPGGSTNGGGGDIKVRAGRGTGSGTGGYLNFQAGDSDTGSGGYINIESGESATTGSGGDITVQARSGGSINLYATQTGTIALHTASSDWTFGATGQMTFPQGTVLSEFIQVSPSVNTFGIFANTVPGRSVTVRTSAGVTNNDWVLGADGGLTFPDTTVQTTAYVAANNVSKVTGTWTVVPGAANYSFTVPLNGTYQLWVRGNVPNGIITYTATAVVTNTNVPVLGTQYGWWYLDGGVLVLTNMPDQFEATEGVISTTNTYVGNAANVFVFGIDNTSLEDATVSWGYAKIS